MMIENSPSLYYRKERKRRDTRSWKRVLSEEFSLSKNNMFQPSRITDGLICDLCGELVVAMVIF